MKPGRTTLRHRVTTEDRLEAITYWLFPPVAFLVLVSLLFGTVDFLHDQYLAMNEPGFSSVPITNPLGESL